MCMVNFVMPTSLYLPNPGQSFVFVVCESMTLLFSKYLISAAAITVVFSVDFEQRCSQFNHSFYHGSSCFIGETNPKTQTSAMASCNHMGKGHLAFIDSQQTLDKLIDLGDQLTGDEYVWIGLVQKDPAPQDEPNGKWSWVHSDGRFWTPNDYQIFPWYPGRPDNTQNAWEGCLGRSIRLVTDCWNVSNAFVSVCEYENSLKVYKKHASNKVGNSATKMQETVENRVEKCAIQCSKELPCKAYSYNGNNGSCILHYLPSNGFTGFEPEDQQGYIMFDTYY